MSNYGQVPDILVAETSIIMGLSLQRNYNLFIYLLSTFEGFSRFYTMICVSVLFNFTASIILVVLCSLSVDNRVIDDSSQFFFRYFSYSFFTSVSFISLFLALIFQKKPPSYEIILFFVGIILNILFLIFEFTSFLIKSQVCVIYESIVFIYLLFNIFKANLKIFKSGLEYKEIFKLLIKYDLFALLITFFLWVYLLITCIIRLCGNSSNLILFSDYLVLLAQTWLIFCVYSADKSIISKEK
jgi:hypothetical protein